MDYIDANTSQFSELSPLPFVNKTEKDVWMENGREALLNGIW